MIDKVSGKRIGNDSNKYLVAFLRELQNGWVPPTDVSREFYYEMKSNKDRYSDCLVGFVGFLCSFGGRWWGGYAADKRGDNYAGQGSRSATKQAKNFTGIDFRSGDYLDMDIPPRSLIYCDPPYEGTKPYRDKFDHKTFWQWCQNRVGEGHTLFVSEYSAPDDFFCVKEVQHKTPLNGGIQSSRVEKLFRSRFG